MKILAAITKCFASLIIQLSQVLRYFKQVSHCKSEREAGGVVIEEFVRFRAKIHSFLVVDNREPRNVNRNVARTVGHN